MPDETIPRADETIFASPRHRPETVAPQDGDVVMDEGRAKILGRPTREGDTSMLAEKFVLYLESLIRSQTYADGSPRVVSTSPHVAVPLLGVGPK